MPLSTLNSLRGCDIQQQQQHRVQSPQRQRENVLVFVVVQSLSNALGKGQLVVDSVKKRYYQLTLLFISPAKAIFNYTI